MISVTQCVIFGEIELPIYLEDFVKKSHVKALLLSLTLTQIMAAKPYSLPQVNDISVNNFNEVRFNEGAAYKMIENKEDVTIGEEIMVKDRYQTTYTEVDGKIVKGRSLGRLDRIQVLDNSEVTPAGKILVKVIQSKDYIMKGKTVLVNLQGLSHYEDFRDIDADVYMVQNIATEKLRVYQRICKDNSCPPKIILETDFVAGMKKGDPTFEKNTRVGNYRIVEWHKFYQDRNGGHYPSWFDPSSPAVPDPDESWSKWFKKDVMPWESCSTDSKGKSHCSSKGMMRGAFGWYTALVEPNANDQWTHGTIGWGDSSVENITRAKGEDLLGTIASVFTSLRSSGCSRVSNKTIAFLRHILPVGTPVIKIYALEKYQDEASMKKTYDKNATFKWDYALTKDGVRGINDAATSAHKNFVTNRTDLGQDDILEEGTYEFTNYPRVVQVKNAKSSKCSEDDSDILITSEDERTDKKQVLISEIKDLKTKMCNLYKIPSEKFQGVFYVDTGLVDGYKHPDAKEHGVIKGGFNSQFLPNFMEIKNYK